MKSGISALDRAACELTSKLNTLLMTELGIQLFDKSFDLSRDLNIVTPVLLDQQAQASFVSIYPVNWPDGSHIHARFVWKDEAWQLYDTGQIWARHLSTPIDGLRFVASHCGMGVVLRQEDASQTQFVADTSAQFVDAREREISGETA